MTTWAEVEAALKMSPAISNEESRERLVLMVRALEDGGVPLDDRSLHALAFLGDYACGAIFMAAQREAILFHMPPANRRPA